MGNIVFLIFIILFLMFLFGLFSIAEGQRGLAERSRSTRYTRNAPPDAWEGQRTTPRAQPATESGSRTNLAARRAMMRAQYTGDDEYVNVMDIGLLAYEGDEPRLVRYNDVETDTDYLRPFVVLRVPYQARGTVRMELVDHGGRVRYADETRYDLQEGDNTLLPGTWLPLRDTESLQDNWELRILVAGTLLAAHTFGWQTAVNELQRYIEDDGEISPELQQAMQGEASRAMSLSQLLSQQDD